MSWQQLGSTTPKARKAYRCEWCGEEIPKDEFHSKIVGVFEGDFQTSRMHSECSKACQVWFKTVAQGEDGFQPHAFKRGTIEEK